MLVARLCRVTLSPNVASILKTPAPKLQVTRLFANESRESFVRSAKSRGQTIEGTFAPAKDSPFKIGQGVVAGASAVGLGALCYYGLGLSSGSGAVDEAGLWPQYVRDRIKSTYMYFGGSILTTGLTAVACLRSPGFLNFIRRREMISMIGMMIATMGTGMICRSIPYEEGFGKKHLAWLVHTGILGAVIAPACIVGGPLVARAALYTAGVVGGLSTIAACAPSEKFLYMGGPLAIGLGVVFVSSIGSMFLPPTSLFGAGIHSIALYGGLLLFSGFLLYDTQHIINNAKQHPVYYPERPYDPINSAIHIYMDTLNIFIRILSIMMNSNRKQ